LNIMAFVECTFDRQGDPNPEFPAGPTRHLREGYQIPLCPARYAKVNS